MSMQPPLPRRFDSSGPSTPHQYDPDEAIRLTDDDAAASRLSAANLQYLPDPFVHLLYKPPHGIPPTRKSPLINIGTHHRTFAVDMLVEMFIRNAGEEGCQIVSLGAGSDTRFWRLLARDPPPNISKYIEIDFSAVTSLKSQRISRSPRLSSLLTPSTSSSSLSSSTSIPLSGDPKPIKVSQGGTRLDSQIYSILPLDLRLQPRQTLERELKPLLRADLPVLFLAECLFCYMKPEISAEVIGWFGGFERCVGVVYEMCGLDDTFGQVMRRNLASRHLTLPGAVPFRDVASQAARFLSTDLGQGVFDQAGSKSLWQVREEVIPEEELKRILKLEILDEIEELRLVLQHYCVAWGTKGPGMDSIGL